MTSCFFEKKNIWNCFEAFLSLARHIVKFFLWFISFYPTIPFITQKTTMNNLYTSPILLLLIGFLYFITFLSNHNRKIASNAENFSKSSSSGSEASGSDSSGSGSDPILDNCTIKSAPNNTFNQIALLSLPGSGNTWTRHLIEQGK